MNRSVLVLPSAARTTTPTIRTFNNANASGIFIIIDVTAVTSSPSVVFTLVGYDEASGKTWTILASAAVATVSTTVLRAGPSLTAVANLTVNDMLPILWSVTAVHGNANSITYSIGSQSILV